MSDWLLPMLRPARARMDLDRLAANYLAVAAAAGRPVMPVVKADAYGHGAARLSRHLAALGAPMLAVAYVEEGTVLRAAGFRSPIVVLAGFGPGQVRSLLQHDLTPVVSTPDTLAAALQAAGEGGRPLSVHLEVDTGMTRLGFTPSEAGPAAARLSESGRVEVAGVMTHLARADEDADATRRQLDLFDQAVDELAGRGIRPRWVHAANSAGLAFLRPSHTLVRPGLLLYGVKPRPLAPAIDVKPVMAVSADVALVKEVAVGTPVSYGGRWVAPRRSRIATIPFGYADGVPRTDGMRDHGELLVKGRRVPVAGAVCMDLTMADLTDHPEAGEGDEAVLFGDDPTAWDVADHAGTNAWEVLTSIGSRVPRVFIERGRVVGVESRFTPRAGDRTR
ncbi:MAG: alanine racemase [Acidobacteria bacterium]|nr:MAG: alanine racemase [Acidobacteriota bacterium]